MPELVTPQFKNDEEELKHLRTMRANYRDGALEAAKTFEDIAATLDANVRLRRGLHVIANYKPEKPLTVDALRADLDEFQRIAKVYLETPE